MEGQAPGLGSMQQGAGVLQVAIVQEQTLARPSQPVAEPTDQSLETSQAAVTIGAEAMTNKARAAETSTNALAQQQSIDPPPNPTNRGLTLQDYLHSGQLTRLPVPAEEINLNVPEIEESPVIGLVDLTILIEANGDVSHVISFPQNDGLRRFAQQVADIFQRARFTPGEINGQPVRSQLQITVVSESSSAL